MQHQAGYFLFFSCQLQLPPSDHVAGAPIERRKPQPTTEKFQDPEFVHKTPPVTRRSRSQTKERAARVFEQG